MFSSPFEFLSTKWEDMKCIAGQAAAASLSGASSDTDPIPKDWDKRALKAWEYYLTIGIVKRCISTWRALVLGDGVRFNCDSEDDRKKLEKFARKIRLEKKMRDMFTQWIVRSEALPYKDEDSKGFKLKLINPLSIEPTYVDGEITKIVQYQTDEKGNINKSDPNPFEGDDLQSFYHMKFDAPEFSPRGNTLLLSAFDLIETLRVYDRADRAIGKRWINPLQLLKLGGLIGKKVFTPDKKAIKDAVATLESRDMEKSLVVPHYWNVETHGTDGEVLNTNDKVTQLEERIAIALLFSPFIVTGRGPNIASARISLKAVKYIITEFVGEMKSFLDWLFDENLLKQIGVDPEANIEYRFTGLDVDAEQWERELYLELYDRNVISKRTLQLIFGVDPASEDAFVAGEPAIIKKTWSPQDVIGLIGVGAITAEEGKALLGLDESDENNPAVAATLKLLKKAESGVLKGILGT